MTKTYFSFVQNAFQKQAILVYFENTSTLGPHLPLVSLFGTYVFLNRKFVLQTVPLFVPKEKK